jgi:glutathione synthase/RimK-type ligase-like ATP-grasp enzyme
VTVLLWGLATDPPLRAVREGLVAQGADVVFVDHAAVAETEVRFADGRFVLTLDGTRIDLDELRAAYLRPYDARLYGAGVAAKATGVHRLVYEWAEGTQVTVVNRPTAEATNHCKLLQAAAIRASGIATPESLVSNEQERILAFRTRHGSVVYKSLSGVRSVVEELRPEGLPSGPMGPAFVQQRIRGTNVRAHVVGARTFACAIESDRIDYRYGSSTLASVELPGEIAARCVDLAGRLGLLLAGVDLIAGDDGTWYGLEVNPSPAFTAYDHDGAIASAVTELLGAS